jgi:hypothetical protein
MDNLQIEISIDGQNTAGGHIGGLIGSMSFNASVSFCSVSGEILPAGHPGRTRVGGISGYSQGNATINGCISLVGQISYGTSSMHLPGGLVGRLDGYASVAHSAWYYAGTDKQGNGIGRDFGEIRDDGTTTSDNASFSDPAGPSQERLDAINAAYPDNDYMWYYNDQGELRLKKR